MKGCARNFLMRVTQNGLNWGSWLGLMKFCRCRIVWHPIRNSSCQGGGGSDATKQVCDDIFAGGFDTGDPIALFFWTFLWSFLWSICEDCSCEAFVKLSALETCVLGCLFLLWFCPFFVHFSPPPQPPPLTTPGFLFNISLWVKKLGCDGCT